MLKRLVSIVLCICLLCGLVTVASAATSTKADKYQIIDILKHLNMLSDDYDSVTIEWNKPLSKAEFAFYAASILKRDYVGQNLHFHDVSRQHWAFSSISSLVENGLLEVGEDKMFSPNENVSTEYAVNVLLKALGYKFEINESIGLTPMKIANNMGITKGVAITDKITFSDAMQLLYNTLIAKTMEITSASGGFGYSASDKTYLESEYYISYKEGVLEGFDGISSNGTSVRENMALISGVEYEVRDIDLSDLIGYKISYIYDFSKNDDSGIILWVDKVSVDELILYYAENEITFDSSNYKLHYYDSNDRQKSVVISKTADVIYNDEYVVSGIEDLLSGNAPKGNMYSVKLIKNSGNNEYSKVILQGYQDVLVGSVDVENEGIFDKLTKSYLSFENSDRLEIFENGNIADFSDLKIGDVLSIYESVSGERVKILVSKRTVSGTVTYKDSKGEYEYIAIGDTEYRGADKGSYWNGSIGFFLVLYLDASGNIAYVERGVQKGNLAYLISVKQKKKENKLLLRMFRTDGSIQDVECAEPVRVGDVKYRYAEAAYTAISDLAPTLVLYKTNDEGLVTHLYLPGTGNNSTLKILQDSATATYRASGRIGRKTFINNDTIIFGIPKNPQNADYDDFEILSKSGMSGDTTYTYSTYTTLDEVGYEEILVLQNYEHKEPGSKGLLVTKIGKCQNDYDEVVDFIEGYSGSNYVSFKCDVACSLASVSLGNYITYELKSNGSISSVTVRCDYENGIKPIETNLHQTKTFSSGYVNDIIGEIVRIGDQSGADFDAAYNFESKIPVIIYNIAEKKARVGSVANLKPYKVAGNGCSFVFTHVVNGGSIIYVVYE